MNHQQGGSTMFKQLKGQKGFTLIELMIVVAIIGILAAIAIPNFLQYQLKSRQAEAKTNLQAIKTSQVAFQAERGCYIGLAIEGSPLVAGKSLPTVWGSGLAPTPPPVAWCAAVGGTFAGRFSDVGFKATGAVNYLYAADATAIGVGPLAVYTPAGVGGTVPSCPLAIAGGAAGAPMPAGNNNFIATAVSDLDGDGARSGWNSTVDHGANDCTTGVF
jgi:type IV pilus assembly protein PilA